MTTMLILIVLQWGTITGHYVGDFDSPSECEFAAQVIYTKMANSELPETIEAAGLLCIDRQEA